MSQTSNLRASRLGIKYIYQDFSVVQQALPVYTMFSDKAIHLSYQSSTGMEQLKIVSNTVGFQIVRVNTFFLRRVQKVLIYSAPQ